MRYIRLGRKKPRTSKIFFGSREKISKAMV
jgi:hypothetical protein